MAKYFHFHESRSINYKSSALQAQTLRVQGGGLVHATHVNIHAHTLIVDDLGEIIGDLHSVTCSQGAGFDGSSGSGRWRVLA